MASVDAEVVVPCASLKKTANGFSGFCVICGFRVESFVTTSSKTLGVLNLSASAFSLPYWTSGVRWVGKTGGMGSFLLGFTSVVVSTTEVKS